MRLEILSAYWLYIKYLLRHKYYVSVECFKEGLYWQGIIHDWQKFLPYCFLAYAGFFNIDKVTYQEQFNKAWLKHIHNSPHHWQYWQLKEDSGLIQNIEMPEKYWKEMICDWYGASIATGNGGRVIEWYNSNKEKIQLHPSTRRKVEGHLNLNKEKYNG